MLRFRRGRCACGSISSGGDYSHAAKSRMVLDIFFDSKSPGVPTCCNMLVYHTSVSIAKPQSTMWRAFRAKVNDVSDHTAEQLAEAERLKMITRVELSEIMKSKANVIRLTPACGVHGVQYLSSCVALCESLKPDTMVDESALVAIHPIYDWNTNSPRIYTAWMLDVYLGFALNETRSVLSKTLSNMVKCCNAIMVSPDAVETMDRKEMPISWVQDVVRLCIYFVRMDHPVNPDEIVAKRIKRLETRAFMVAIMCNINAIGTVGSKEFNLTRFNEAHDLYEWCTEIKKQFASLPIDHLNVVEDSEWRRLCSVVQQVADLQQHYFLFHRLKQHNDFEDATYCLNRVASLAVERAETFDTLSNDMKQYDYVPAVAVHVPVALQKEHNLPPCIPPVHIQRWLSSIRNNLQYPTTWLANASVSKILPRFDLRKVATSAVVSK